MSKKQPESKPESGARVSGSKRAAIANSGARGTGKDRENVRDAYREGNRPSAWRRKTYGHADAKAAVREGGSVH